MNLPGLVMLPVTLVHAVDHLVNQLGQVATRALALLDVAEPVAERVATVVGRAEGAATDVEELTEKAAKVATQAEEATELAAGVVAAVQPLVQAVTAIDPEVLTRLVAEADELLPALRSLPTVLEQLASQVDHLDRTVAEVGAMLSGIPGAARLAKRGGERLTGR